MSTSKYDYSAAFARNTGWVTKQEQSVLRSKRVAIAGLGGVGGSHLLTLTRLGIGSFMLADFDTFEIANFNRQAGASLATLGRKKTDVLLEQALDINPQLDIRIFPEGVHDHNAADFLTEADLYLDGLDFFAIQARRTIFDICAQLDIPAVTAAPLGMGVALLNFLPGGMTFEEYFQLAGHDEEEQLLRFLLGLSPAMLQGGYLVDPTAVRLAEHKGPSTAMACELCAGVAGTQVLKILLGRGKVISAPRGLHFDAYRNRLVQTWRPGGNRNPLQQLGLKVARRRFGKEFMNKMAPQKEPEHMPGSSTAYQILHLARWAPSGDNAQPWRFKVVDDNHIVIHGRDTRDHCIYDLQGHASQLAIGTLLQTLAIAASKHRLRADFSRRQDAPVTRPTIDVLLTDAPDIPPDPLLPFITERTVNRRRLSTRPLTVSERSQLEEAVGPGYRIIWFESFQSRFRISRLLYRNGGLRLHMPEAYQTHKSVIQWNSFVSEDRIPDRAVGLDPLTTHLMRWAMTSWKRVSFLNKYMAGTQIPRMELDFIPGMACAAHFLVIADSPPASIDNYIEAGMAVQRFWLTATRLGLLLQPEMTPLIFDSYVRENVDFTRHKKSFKIAESLSKLLREIITPETPNHAVFMGRLGAGHTPAARSVRLPVKKLLAVETER